MIVFGAGMLLLQHPTTPTPESGPPTTASDADAEATPIYLPAAFPHHESDNLRRIREARTRIQNIKKRHRKTKPSSDGTSTSPGFPTRT